MALMAGFAKSGFYGGGQTFGKAKLEFEKLIKTWLDPSG
jgi:hypothetical protein